MNVLDLAGLPVIRIASRSLARSPQGLRRPAANIAYLTSDLPASTRSTSAIPKRPQARRVGSR